MEMEDDMVATLLNDWMQGLFFSFSCKFYLFTACFNSRIKLNVLFEECEQGYIDIFEGSKSNFFLFCAWFLRAYSMEPVHDIFLSSLTSRL